VGATIFNGPRVKALKKIFGLNGGVDIISSTTDPTSVAVSASIGSLLLNESNGSAYLKQDAGSSTNWSQLTSGTPSVSATTRTVSQVAHGFAVGDVVFLSAANTFAKAKADADSTSEVIGVVHSVPNANSFSMTMTGRITGLSGLTAGGTYFLSPTTAGAITLTEPTTSGQISKPILVAESTTTAYVVQFRGAVIGGGGGATITSWSQYTPTFTGFGTVSTQSFWFRQIGDSYEIQGKFTSGSTTATQAQITLPSSTVSSTKVPAIRAGGFYFLGGSSVSFKGGSVLINGGNSFINLSNSNGFSGTNTDTLAAETANNIAASGSVLSICVTIPITGL
jgi:hypothetical protein